MWGKSVKTCGISKLGNDLLPYLFFVIYAKMTCRCVFRSKSYIFGCLLMTVEALMNAVYIERNIAVNTQMASVHEEIEEHDTERAKKASLT